MAIAVFVQRGGQSVQIKGKWDLIIAHPPCTYLSNAGARWLYRVIDGETFIARSRLEKGLDAKSFFERILSCECDHIAIENPIPSAVFRLPKYDMIIQPYQFGHPVTKKTCLWLKGLPMLSPTRIVAPDPGREFVQKNGKKRKSCWCMDCGRPFGGMERARERAKTFPGIARAMAEQWG